AQRPPPLGDVVPIALTFPGRDVPFDGRAKVGRVEAGSYALELVDATADVEAELDRFVAAKARLAAAGPRGAERRTTTRVAVRAPVKVSAPPEVMRLSYPDAGAFVSDYVDNLSAVGAFVRSANRVPLHTAVTLELQTPDGRVFRAPGTVVNIMPAGMGVQFH